MRDSVNSVSGRGSGWPGVRPGPLAGSYRPPAWLAEPAPTGRRHELVIRAPSLGAAVEVTLWSPAGLADEEPASLLVAHDGPEYDRVARLTDYLAARVADGRVPPVRAALLGAADREGWYSANDAYARVLAGTVVPELARRVPTRRRIGMGTSLGALAMLHAHQCGPGLFDALFLQSGSFFQPVFDAQEAGFAHYGRIVAFVAAVIGGSPVDHPVDHPVPTVMTCGGSEENLHNNRAMAAALRSQCYEVALHESPGGHDFTAWRDALDPPLGRLLAGS
jgi:enterochelin esterase-like enzyme